MDFFKSYFDLYRIIKIKIVEGYNTTFRSFEKKEVTIISQYCEKFRESVDSHVNWLHHSFIQQPVKCDLRIKTILSGALINALYLSNGNVALHGNYRFRLCCVFTCITELPP